MALREYPGLTEADHQMYPGFRDFQDGPLKRTIAHNIVMERKYGIPPGANTNNPRYADPNDFWRKAERGNFKAKDRRGKFDRAA